MLRAQSVQLEPRPPPLVARLFVVQRIEEAVQLLAGVLGRQAIMRPRERVPFEAIEQLVLFGGG